MAGVEALVQIWAPLLVLVMIWLGAAISFASQRLGRRRDRIAAQEAAADLVTTETTARRVVRVRRDLADVDEVSCPCCGSKRSIRQGMLFGCRYCRDPMRQLLRDPKGWRAEQEVGG